MKMRNSVVLALVVLAASSQAAVITQWDFNAAGMNVNTPAASTGSGAASLLGGLTGSQASGTTGGPSSDPTGGTNNAWNTTGYPAQGTGTGTAGVQFLVSTIGKKDITVSFDQRHSATASGWTLLQYTTDGTSWINSDMFSVGDTNFHNLNSVTLSGVPSANNNAKFGIRIVTVFAPGSGQYSASTSTASYGTAGTIRYDMVTISGTDAVPEPATLTVLGLGTLALARRVRK